MRRPKRAIFPSLIFKGGGGGGGVFLVLGLFRRRLQSWAEYLTIIPRARMGSESIRPHGLLT